MTEANINPLSAQAQELQGATKLTVPSEELNEGEANFGDIMNAMLTMEIEQELALDLDGQDIADGAELNLSWLGDQPGLDLSSLQTISAHPFTEEAVVSTAQLGVEEGEDLSIQLVDFDKDKELEGDEETQALQTPLVNTMTVLNAPVQQDTKAQALVDSSDIAGSEEPIAGSQLEISDIQQDGHFEQNSHDPQQDNNPQQEADYQQEQASQAQQRNGDNQSAQVVDSQAKTGADQKISNLTSQQETKPLVNPATTVDREVRTEQTPLEGLVRKLTMHEKLQSKMSGLKQAIEAGKFDSEGGSEQALMTAEAEPTTQAVVPETTPTPHTTAGIQAGTQKSTPAPLPVMHDQVQASVTHEKWREELGEKLVIMVNNKFKRASLALQPAELGPLAIELEMEQNKAQLVFTSSNELTKAALEASTDKLKEMFEAEHLELINVQVDVSKDQQSSAQAYHQSRPYPSKQYRQGAELAEAGSGRTAVPRLKHGLIDEFA